MSIRSNGRLCQQLRPTTLTPHYLKHAEGSVLICSGETHVICSASIIPGVPSFLKGCNQGWLTAEYGMIPRATHERTQREASKGKQTGRTQEIQRLIGRALRSCVQLEQLPEVTIYVDCDVIQADGGTRTASITGSVVALYEALVTAQRKGLIDMIPFTGFVAAISVGISNGQAVLDLDYHEDSRAETDMNIVMNEAGRFIEIQGTAEHQDFSEQEFQEMLTLAKGGIQELIALQRKAIDEIPPPRT